jgi:hypothetical protein
MESIFIICLLLIFVLYLLGALVVYKLFVQMAYCAFRLQQNSDAYRFLVDGIHFMLRWPLDFFYEPKIILRGYCTRNLKDKYKLAIYYGSQKRLKNTPKYHP